MDTHSSGCRSHSTGTAYTALVCVCVCLCVYIYMCVTYQLSKSDQMSLPKTQLTSSVTLFLSLCVCARVRVCVSHTPSPKASKKSVPVSQKVFKAGWLYKEGDIRRSNWKKRCSLSLSLSVCVCVCVCVFLSVCVCECLCLCAFSLSLSLLIHSGETEVCVCSFFILYESQLDYFDNPRDGTSQASIDLSSCTLSPLSEHASTTKVTLSPVCMCVYVCVRDIYRERGLPLLPVCVRAIERAPDTHCVCVRYI